MRPGDTLGDYRIESVLGRGGMATVYLAHQRALDRRVAIKVLPDFLAEEEGFRERFRQEAIAIARLRHPAILVVFDYGEQDGTPYLVSEYVEGGTLADRLGAPLPVAEALALLDPIAGALDFAHEQGIIHRDVKPANILLAGDGRPMLADFGLAKLLDNQRRLTQSGMVLGTPHYMAPEIATGDVMGPSVDRYALAVITYEMLTGVLPFEATTPQSLLLLHVQQPPPPPRVANPALSPAVEAVLLRGLEKAPEARYPTATAFVTALREAATEPAFTAGSDRAVDGPDRQARAASTIKLPAAKRSRPLSTVASPRRVSRRALLSAGMLALLVTGGAIAAYEAHSSNQAAGIAAGNWSAAGSLDAPVAFAEAVRLPDGNALVVGGYGPDGNGRLADEYDAAYGTWITLPAMPTARSRFTATALADGRILVAGGDTNTTFTAGAQLYDPRRRQWRATGSMHFARRSHAAVRLRDGTVLVVGGEDAKYTPLRSAEIYNPATGTWAATGSTMDVHYGDSAVLLPNGNVLLAGGGSKVCEIYDPRARRWRPAASMHQSRLGHTLTLLGDGKVLATGGADPGDTIDQASAEIYDPAANTWTVAASMHAPRSLHTATLLGDGTVLVAGGRDGKQMLASAERFDPATGRWTIVAAMHARRAQQVAVALDGGKVLIAGGIAGSDNYLATAEVYSTS